MRMYLCNQNKYWMYIQSYLLARKVWSPRFTQKRFKVFTLFLPLVLNLRNIYNWELLHQCGMKLISLWLHGTFHYIWLVFCWTLHKWRRSQEEDSDSLFLYIILIGVMRRCCNTQNTGCQAFTEMINEMI